jgi:hypothetical protein
MTTEATKMEEWAKEWNRKCKERGTTDDWYTLPKQTVQQPQAQWEMDSRKQPVKK